VTQGRDSSEPVSALLRVWAYCACLVNVCRQALQILGNGVAIRYDVAHGCVGVRRSQRTISLRRQTACSTARTSRSRRKGMRGNIAGHGQYACNFTGGGMMGRTRCVAVSLCGSMHSKATNWRSGSPPTGSRPVKCVQSERIVLRSDLAIDQQAKATLSDVSSSEHRSGAARPFMC